MGRFGRFALWCAFTAPVGLLLVWSFVRIWPWPNLLPGHWQATAWTNLGGTAELGAAALRSLGIALVVAGAATTLGFATSQSAARARRHGALQVLLHLPFAMSPVVLGVSLEYLFLRGRVANHWYGVALAQGLPAYAYAVSLLSGFWSARTRAQVDAATTLGATPRQVWSCVLLPMARPLLALCLMQTFLISWFDYALVLLIGGGRVATLTTSLYQFIVSGDMRLAAAGALLLLMPPIGLVVAQWRWRSAGQTALADT